MVQSKYVEALSNLINANIGSTMYKMFWVLWTLFIVEGFSLENIYTCFKYQIKWLLEQIFIHLHTDLSKFILFDFIQKRCIMLMDVCIFIYVWSLILNKYE